jgi:hypothetical protein
MAGLQTRTYTLAGESLTAGTFASISQLLGSAQSTTNPEGMTKVVRISMSCSPDHTSATDGCSVFKFAGDGVSVQQIMAGPSWSNQAAGPLDGNNGMPVVIENSGGVFDIIAGNQIDFSVSCTTAETVDVALSITYSA